MANVTSASVYRRGKTTPVETANDMVWLPVVWDQFGRESSGATLVFVLDDFSQVAISTEPNGEVQVVTHNPGEPSVFEQLGQA